MTSPDKVVTGGSDVTVSPAMSQNGNVGRERREMKRAGIVGEVRQSVAVTTHTSTSPYVPASSLSLLSNSTYSAGTADRHSGNGSRNAGAGGWAQSVGSLRQKLEEVRPTSSSSTLCRAKTVGPISGRSSCDAGADSRTSVTITTGSHSASLRQAATADGSSRLPAQSTAGRSSLVSLSTVADCRSNAPSALGEALPVQGLLGSFPTFSRRSSGDAVLDMRPTSTSTMQTHHPTHLQTVKNTNLGQYPTVSGSHRSVTSSSSATVDDHSTSMCHVSAAGDDQNQSTSVNFGSRASASPQLRRWQCRSESGSQSSTATQIGSVDHHHSQLQLQKPDNATKPHSLPCSPRLQARLAATQPWLPWSPSKSDDAVVTRPVQVARTGNDQIDSLASISQLASSLLLTKLIRDHQDLESRGNYIRWTGKVAIT